MSQVYFVISLDFSVVFGSRNDLAIHLVLFPKKSLRDAALYCLSSQHLC